MALPFLLDASVAPAFFRAFDDELSKISNAGAEVAKGILSESAKNTLHAAAPALVAGGLLTHYGSKTGRDWKKGRSDRRMMEMQQRMQGM